MIWGIPEPVFLALHVALSLVGIGAGLVALVAMGANRHLSGWAALFLGTTLLTDLTGFPLPPFGLDPPRIVGIIDLGLVLGAVTALYLFGLSRAWRGSYVICSAAALYLNVFVAITQAFQKIPPLRALAPTQSELPFIVVQFAGLIALSILGLRAFRRFGHVGFRRVPPAGGSATA